MKGSVNKRIVAVGLLALITCAPLFGCLAEESKSQSAAQQGPQPAPAAAVTPATPAAGASFINKVWQVSKSNGVAEGSLRVFLSEGTLVMASANAKPALGSWKYENGGLTIVEEGRPYKTDILQMSANEFQIKINGPGTPIEITFVPAESPAPK